MAVVRLAYKLNSGANVIDLAFGLSLTERRMIHQKQVFTVMGGLISDGNISGSGDKAIKISTAPNNFYTRNAVTRGFRAWKAMRAKALEGQTGTKAAKYADFKVLLDQCSTYLSPCDAGTNNIASGEWEYSTLTHEQGGGQKLMIVGRDHDTAQGRYSLARGWLETRAAPQVEDPTMPDLDSDGNEDIKSDFLNTLFQDNTEVGDRLEFIVDENDATPFARTTLMTTGHAYSANEPKNLQLQFFADPTLDDLHMQIPGFQALCGLIRVDVGENYTNPILILDVETKGWNF